MTDKELFERHSTPRLVKYLTTNELLRTMTYEEFAASLQEREHEHVATEINRIAKMWLKDLVGDASSILVQLSRVEAAFKKFRREPATQPTPNNKIEQDK